MEMLRKSKQATKALILSEGEHHYVEGYFRDVRISPSGDTLNIHDGLGSSWNLTHRDLNEFLSEEPSEPILIKTSEDCVTPINGGGYKVINCLWERLRESGSYKSECTLLVPPTGSTVCVAYPSQVQHLGRGVFVRIENRKAGIFISEPKGTLSYPAFEKEEPDFATKGLLQSAAN